MVYPVVIIGSGFSGLSAAFHLAEAGRKVLLIEKKEETGGYFRELKRQFPTNSCGVCFMYPQYPAFCPHIEGDRHPNIDVLTSSEVTSVEKDGDNYLLKVKGNGGEKEFRVNHIVFATGFELFDIGGKPEYGGGVYRNVVSAIDMERMIYEYSARGDSPTFGKLAYIQCVGSRDLKAGRPYCSSFCCMFAIKQAMLIKELNEEADITIFYMDIRAFGRDYERYYLEAKDMGIKFVRSAVATVRKRPATGRLEILFTKNGNAAEEVFDTVVLSQGVGYDEGIVRLLKSLNVTPDFYAEKPFHEKELAENVYLTGTAFEPMDIPDSVVDGAFVASKILEKTGISKTDGPITVMKSGKIKNIGIVACSLPEDYVITLRETFKDIVAVKTPQEIGYFVEQQHIDALVVVCEDIRKLEAYAKQNNYFGVHINAFYSVPAKKENTIQEIASAFYRLKNVKKQSYQVRNINQRVLVLGGGLAGVSAARKLSRLGFDVVLVEKEQILGGRALKIEERKEFVKGIIADIEREKKVELLTGFQVKEIKGRFGDFRCMAESENEKREIKAGAILIATGAGERRGLFSYEDNKRVFTAFDFEYKKKEISDAKKIVMLQCAGSRTKDNPVCYRVCCLKAVKNAIAVKTGNPGTDVYILHKDIRTYGFRENLYREARSLGVQFIRFEEEPAISLKGDNVSINVKEEGTGLTFSLEADYLILSTGVDPNTGDLPLNLLKDSGFLTPYNKKGGVLDIGKGVFAAGLCVAPNYSDDVIKQAEAAAIRIAIKLSGKQLVTAFDTAFVNERYCCGCELCVKACPVSARYMDDERKIALVDETLCEGCGTCAMVCANKASQHKLFEHKSMLKTVDLMLG